jgi:MoaA/NifB/PqqE/SkfB family radical SAM enzyme
MKGLIMDLQVLGRQLAKSVPAIEPGLKSLYHNGTRWRHSLSETWPSLVRARTEKITIAITANCNLRCTGCRYGRDFMPGSILPYEIVEGILEDAAKHNIPAVRLYGGEPLLHPDLPKMVRAAGRLGVGAYLTTNAIVLGQKIAELHESGLRKATIGYYGENEDYDRYVQRPGRYKRLVNSLDTTRRLFGPDAFQLQFNFLLSKRSSSISDFEKIKAMAERYDARIQIDIVHYSLPYFQDGPELDIQFGPDDAEKLHRMAEYLVKLKATHPHLLTESEASLASIPDWALSQDQIKIPCDAGKLLWIGADGSVQLCYVTFDLGNLHEKRLSEMLYTPAHHQAARDAFALNCPNCHCERGARVEKHGATFAKYKAAAQAMRSA